MVETTELSITRASQLTIPNKDWTHYRSGLKLRCTDTPGGVTISVISQGKSIDNTFVVAGRVRFLTKQPIVGLKVFDGDRLQKRLQITFSADGDFNMFANRIRQWIDVDVFKNDPVFAASAETFSSQNESQKSQVTPQVKTQNMSQNLSQNQMSQYQMSQNAISQNDMSQNIPQNAQNHVDSQLSQFSQNLSRQDSQIQSSQFAPTESENASSNRYPQMTNRSFDPFSALLDAATNYSGPSYVNDYDQSTRSNGNSNDSINDHSVLSQSTQLWNHESSNTSYTQKKVTGADLTRSLREIPCGVEKKKKPKKKHGVDRILESTIHQVLQDTGPSILSLDDPALTLKVARKLKSKSFTRLLERVENLLD